MKKALLYIFLLIHATLLWSGVIEHEACCPIPALGKKVYMFGEEHTDPFEAAAVAQREQLAQSIGSILDTHQGSLSCYLECDGNVQESIQESPYFYLRSVADRGAFFEQWYVPLARNCGQAVGVGRLCISNFDIRDAHYAQFERDMRLLVDKEISREEVDFDAMRRWTQVIDHTVDALFEELQTAYPKKMVSYIRRDKERKKKRFARLIDSNRYHNKRARYTDRALIDFYNYTDLLADFTILNKVAKDPREIIILNAGSAHTKNLSRYLNSVGIPFISSATGVQPSRRAMRITALASN